MRQFTRIPPVVVVRSILFHLFSVCVVLIFFPFLVLLWAPYRVGWPVWKAFLRVQLWLLRVICNQRYEMDIATVPARPVIFACRHESLWESLVLPITFDNPVMFAKAETFRIPIVAAIARKMGCIALDRTGAEGPMRAAFDTAWARAAEGASFLIFPNGTRNPQHRYRLQKGVALLYRGLKLDVVPMVVDSGTFWPHRSFLRYPGTIRLRALPVIPVGLRTSDFLARLEEDLAQPA
jgi:1-acyl-sn-glycerol-3-phosphate acyltransferase